MVHLRPESQSFSPEGNWSSSGNPRRGWIITQHAADPSTVDHFDNWSLEGFTDPLRTPVVIYSLSWVPGFLNSMRAAKQ